MIAQPQNSRIRHAAALGLALAMFVSPASGAAQRRPAISSDPGYFASPSEATAIAWSARDRAWYRQNRRIAAAGKVLTVLGLAATFGLGVPQRNEILVLSGVATQFSGQITWSIADLRAANHMRRGGLQVGRGAGIAALCGAFLLSPVLWIAGPIQSAQLRRAQASASRVPPSGLAVEVRLAF